MIELIRTKSDTLKHSHYMDELFRNKEDSDTIRTINLEA